ncbi:hypothetical protein JL100_023830 [Skermanella mucosa]|jgi:hypothetical protein|uniref:hypothetical protein n=1 Tax=Skermanella mucosa TaxID=1789672 RepID=UPI00192BE204|nr:hypothetical protein [Skermanella mucosa]UEM20077.1 hypothetical protein JL100_023830 [Skermanella mucosa]
MRPLLTAAFLATATLAAGGCTTLFPETSAAQACAELPPSVWPWQPVRNARIEFLPEAGTQALFPTRMIQVRGTIEGGDGFREPVPVTFECVFRGDQLKSFGWIEPAQFITPYTE